jgi:hypothetical protein
MSTTPDDTSLNPFFSSSNGPLTEKAPKECTLEPFIEMRTYYLTASYILVFTPVAGRNIFSFPLLFE